MNFGTKIDGIEAFCCIEPKGGEIGEGLTKAQANHIKFIHKNLNSFCLQFLLIYTVHADSDQT